VKKKTYYLLLFLLVACTARKGEEVNNNQPSNMMEHEKGTFGYDFEFLRKRHPDAVLLHDDAHKAQLVVLPAYQGRVMTSTAGGNAGASFGWINYALIDSQQPAAHMHAFGGEERFWLGPEGGQFSIYFKKGVDFTYDNWEVPREIDTEPFTLIGSSPEEAQFEKEMHLENYSGTKFDLRVNRTIRLLHKEKVDSLLGVAISPTIETVAFESENILSNMGTQRWSRSTGLLSIWILSMMNASEKTTVAIPFRKGDDRNLGKVVTDDYFGKVPDDRLVIRDGLILFKADGKFRSKIGISPQRATGTVASFDAANSVLTIATFSLPEGNTEYVNSLWELQKEPFRGDAINSYNDGPVNGGQMGNLYEIESSSPAAALGPGESLTHYHRTIHLKGTTESLDAISMKVLGVHLGSISL